MLLCSKVLYEIQVPLSRRTLTCGDSDIAKLIQDGPVCAREEVTFSKTESDAVTDALKKLKKGPCLYPDSSRYVPTSSLVLRDTQCVSSACRVGHGRHQ